MGQTLNLNMIPDCTDPANCDNESCQAYLVSLHEISQTDYQLMVSQFFGSLKPAVSIAASDIDPTNVQCNSTVGMYFHGDEMNRSSNVLSANDVAVQIAQGPFFSGKYSITLFKGLIRLFQPDAFHFSKGISLRTGDFTLTFYLTRSGSDNPIYFGDLSDVYP